jgi:hypothetical protein
MKGTILFLVFAFLLTITPSYGQSGFENFISCRGDKLMDGKEEFRFISFSIPDLHFIDDYFLVEASNQYRLPDEFEITDALKTIKQMGGQVVRMYAIPVRKKGEDDSVPKYVLGPGKFSEDAFKVLDKVLELAGNHGIRVLVELGCQYDYWGGFGSYAEFRNKKLDDFWTDPQLIADYKATIKYVLTRKNAYTGVCYKDDKTIFAWSTGAELFCPNSWTGEIASFIKSIDTNHLLIDGFAWEVREDAIKDKNIDVVKVHLYPHCCKPPVGPNEPEPLLKSLLLARERSKGKKPLIIGEFGLVTTSTAQKIVDAVIEQGVSGALMWSLIGHSRDGGFYWHTEINDYRAYHWPGFRSGDPIDEKNLLEMMRQNAFQIRRIPVPPITAPDRPVLLPIKKVSAISWQGSTGAQSYDIERAECNGASWGIVGRDVSDAVSQYNALFNDTSVELGHSYKYRVKAKNMAGISVPSNEVGPVKVEYLTLVDEMMDHSLLHSWSGNLSLELKKDTSMAKEETYRLKGSEGSWIIYKVPASIIKFKVYALFPDNVSDLKFSISSDGRDFSDIIPEKKVYTYRWKPVVYQKEGINGSRYLKIEFSTTSQISRIEIAYGG